MTHESVVRIDSIGAEVRIDVRFDMSGHGGSQAAPPESSARLALAPPASASALTLFEQALCAGNVVGGRYELVRMIGRGSMGAVWLANHTTLGERVALKLMTPSSELDAAEDGTTAAARFRFEAQVAARLSRKTRHVVRVTDHGQDGPVPYLVMELLEGKTLEHTLLCRGPMGIAEVAGLVTQIARGLEAAHAEGILHRDLKPANVFLVDAGEGPPLVKLLDFGVARGSGLQRVGAPFSTARGLVVGTPSYMSPEQAAASDLDVRSDLWSLAAIAYEALTGELPVSGIDGERVLANLRACRTVPVRDYRPDLPESCERFFERAFAPRIEDRYATCAELAAAFERAGLSGGTVKTAHAGDGRPTLRLPAAPVFSSGQGLGARSARFAAVSVVVAAGLFGAWYALGASRSPAIRAGASTLAEAATERPSARLSPQSGMPPEPETPGGGAPSGGLTADAPPQDRLRAASDRLAPVTASTPEALSVAQGSSPALAPKAGRPSAAGNPTSGLGEFKASY
jgi:hypothetical protein